MIAVGGVKLLQGNRIEHPDYILEKKLKDISNGNISEEQKANLGEDYQNKALDMLDQLNSFLHKWNDCLAHLLF